MGKMDLNVIVPLIMISYDQPEAGSSAGGSIGKQITKVVIICQFATGFSGYFIDPELDQAHYIHHC